jgi:CRP-like cAMP-binding protein
MDIFEELAPADLDQVAKLLKDRRVSEGSVLFRQGDPGDTMFVVQEGRVKIVTADSMGREKVLAFYGEGGFFGEMALLTGAPRTATALAATNTRLLEMRKDDFDLLLSANATIMKEMLKVAARRQVATGRRALDRGEDSASQGNLYSVYAPRGGSGRTTVAVNLAIAFTVENPDRVTLLDLDVTFGHTTLSLNVTPKSSLASASSETLRHLDRESISYYLVTHESSLRVFAGSTRPEEGETVSGEHVRAALSQLQKSFGHVIVDTTGNFSETTLAALEQSDKIVFIVNPEPASVRDSRECIRIFTDLLQMPAAKFYYVLNHVVPYKGPSREEVQAALGVEFALEIPYAGDLPSQSALRGEPFVLRQSGAAISKAIEHMRRDLERQAAELSVGLIGSGS